MLWGDYLWGVIYGGVIYGGMFYVGGAGRSAVSILLGVGSLVASHLSWPSSRVWHDMWGNIGSRMEGQLRERVLLRAVNLVFTLIVMHVVWWSGVISCAFIVDRSQVTLTWIRLRGKESKFKSVLIVSWFEPIQGAAIAAGSLLSSLNVNRSDGQFN